MLVVSLESHTGSYQLWAFDGTGWWLMRETAVTAWVWPVALAGAGTFDLLTFRNGDSGVIYDLIRMSARGPSTPAYAPSGRFTTSLLDAGERDATKSWRAVGATFTAPETRGNPASSDAVTLTLDWSIDAGESWTSAASVVVNDPSQRVFGLSAVLPANAAVAPFLQLRVGFASVSDWAPVLAGIWADYAVLDAPPRRRRWSFSVIARDSSIQRDASVAHARWTCPERRALAIVGRQPDTIVSRCRLRRQPHRTPDPHHCSRRKRSETHRCRSLGNVRSPARAVRVVTAERAYLSTASSRPGVALAKQQATTRLD